MKGHIPRTDRHLLQQLVASHGRSYRRHHAHPLTFNSAQQIWRRIADWHYYTVVLTEVISANLHTRSRTITPGAADLLEQAANDLLPRLRYGQPSTSPHIQEHSPELPPQLPPSLARAATALLNDIPLTTAPTPAA
jgi:hypothetical protein